MTPKEHPPTLSEVWPEVAARLAGMLRRRGVDGATVEDIVQETAIRVVRSSVRFTDGDDLFRWVAVVGWRLALDARRKTERTELGAVPDRAGPIDVDHLVEQRSQLDATVRGLDRLSCSDRQAILSGLKPSTTSSRQEAVRLAVRRHRARARLMALLEGAGAVLAWLGFRRRAVGLTRKTVVAATALPAVCLVALLVPYHAPETGGPSTAPPAPPGGAPEPVLAGTGTPSPSGAPPAQPAAGTLRAPPPGPVTSPSGGGSSQLPAAHVDVPGPDGRPGRIGARPKQAGDRVLCLDPVVTAYSCRDLPLPPVTGGG